MADISLSLLVLEIRQVEQFRAFYQALGVDLVEEIPRGRRSILRTGSVWW
jgi:hypothetical protein